MAQITLKGNPIHTVGELIQSGQAPDFKLVDKDLKDLTLKDFSGQKKVITTVPSLDTGVCSLMTKHLNDLAKKHPQVAFITVSADLPFAQARFCKGEDVQNVVTLSMMRSKDFGRDYGVLIVDGPLSGILARSVLVLNEQNQVTYAELVSEIGMEPNFAALAQALQQ